MPGALNAIADLNIWVQRCALQLGVCVAGLNDIGFVLCLIGFTACWFNFELGNIQVCYASVHSYENCLWMVQSRKQDGYLCNGRHLT